MFKLRINNISYIHRYINNIDVNDINDNNIIKITCIIEYYDPVYNQIKHAKGSAKRHPDDKYNEEIGKHIAESRARLNMYNRFCDMFVNVSNDTLFKYEKYLDSEKKHINYIMEKCVK